MDEILSNATKILTEDLKFTWHDYMLFSFMLLLSMFIGLYFGCTGKKQSSAEEYLLGGKEMKIVPIAMSLISSYISGVTILAVPSDVYQFGISYGICSLMVPLGIWVSYIVFMPVFIDLQLPSTYEYLNMRFNRRVRVFCSFLFSLSVILYLPIVIYVPALALSQGTGFNVHYITPVICGVCIFYTTIGGLKAVVWTDTLQIVLMIGSTIIFTGLGTASAGGFGRIMQISGDTGRLSIDYRLDLTKRDSFWTGTIGLFCGWFAHTAINQGCIQKCISLPSRAHVKKSLIIFGIGMGTFIGISSYTGLMMYAKYNGCDPLKASIITKNDQLLPYFVLDVARNIPGLPGLFIAGVFSAALSSLSGCMNGLSCTIYEDFISHHMPKDITQKKVSNILKLIVFIIGVIATSLIYVVEHMGGILELGFSLGGIVQGPQLGIFVLGMLFPAAKSKGALYGGITSLLFGLWVICGEQYYKFKGFHHPTLPIYTDKCDLNLTLATLQPPIDWEPPNVYQISHYFITMLGSIVVLVVGLLISRFSKCDDPPVDRKLISPVMQWAMPEEKVPEYYTIDHSLQIMNEKQEVL